MDSREVTILEERLDEALETIRELRQEIENERYRGDVFYDQCEQDKEIKINGNRYWCVKIQNKKEN